MRKLMQKIIGFVCLFQITIAVLANPGLQGEGVVKAEDIAVVIGASYAQSWNVDRLDGLKVVNAGVDGQQSFELLERFQHDVLDRKPRMVVIWGYINDIHRNPRDKIDQTKQRAKDSFIKMVELAQQNDVIPVLATEVTIRPPDGWKETVMGWIGDLRGKQGYQAYVNQHVSQLNIWLRRYAAENGLRLLDFEPLLAGKDGVRLERFATPDGTHINAAAYKRLSEYTQTQLR
ncbi:hypothetical protein MNBD_GAMMA15-654 [hydrothermal vent metagenome]|uniref:SGNH hydrolase-type esterase domain-containing protein n=1 Tax=hydrothermal vent metagenome TaxID=652676 RepID=A0A3B0Y8W5_9ZZZZ